MVQVATKQWHKIKACHHYFDGQSHTAPTPKEWSLQRLGLAIRNVVCLHVSDKEQGLIVEPSGGFGEEFEGVDMEFDFTNAQALWNDSSVAAGPQIRDSNDDSPMRPVVEIAAALLESIAPQLYDGVP